MGQERAQDRRTTPETTAATATRRTAAMVARRRADGSTIPPRPWVEPRQLVLARRVATGAVCALVVCLGWWAAAELFPTLGVAAPAVLFMVVAAVALAWTVSVQRWRSSRPAPQLEVAEDPQAWSRRAAAAHALGALLKRWSDRGLDPYQLADALLTLDVSLDPATLARVGFDALQQQRAEAWGVLHRALGPDPTVEQERMRDRRPDLPGSP